MTLQDWLNKNFTHITLTTTIQSKHGTMLTVPDLNVELTCGLISTDNKEDFAKLVFKYLPVGTIIEPIDSEWYETNVLAVRNLLTRLLLTTTNPIYKKYMDILERRDKDRWAKEQKATQVKATTDAGISLEFTVVS